MVEASDIECGFRARKFVNDESTVFEMFGFANSLYRMDCHAASSGLSSDFGRPGIFSNQMHGVFQ